MIRRRAHSYFALSVELGAIAALALALRLPSLADWQGLVVFGLLCLGAEWAEVSLPGGILSTSFAVIYPAFLLYGWPAAALVAAISLIIAGRLQKRQRGVVLFNAGQIVLSILAGGLLSSLAGGTVGFAVASADQVLPLLLFPLGYFLANHILVGTFFTLRAGAVDWSGTWLEPARWDLLNFLVAVPLGIVVAQLYDTRGLMGALLLFVPFFAVAYIFRLSVRLSLVNRELEAFQGFSQAVSGSFEIEGIFKSILKSLERIIPFDTAVLLIWDEADQVLIPGVISHPDPDAVSAIRIKRGEGIIGEVADTRRPGLVHDTRSLRHDSGLATEGYPVRSQLMVPLVSEQILVGVLVLGKRESGAYTDRHLNRLMTLAGLAAVAIEQAIHHQRTVELAITDEKTGLFNYRYFIDQLGEELKVSKRRQAPLSLIYLDIDHFRETNNTYGHEAADGVLRDVTAILKRCVRDSDLVARYGGEEFIIMLPRAASRDAQVVAERIRRGVERTIFRDRATAAIIRTTISAGVASFPQDGESPSELVYKADLAMLRGAKERGRNRVAVYGDIQ